MTKKITVLELIAVREEIPVKITNAAEVTKSYTLKEFNGKGRDMYMDSIRDKANINAEGNVVGFKTFDGIQSSLLALCLYDEADKLVPEEVIQEFPVKVLATLFTAAQQLNGLAIDAAAKAELKNG